MRKLYSKYFCTCGHLGSAHYLSPFGGIDDSLHGKPYICDECLINYSDPKKKRLFYKNKPWNYGQHEFKLDNLKYLEQKALDK